jgi:hypothetical protein
MQGRKPFKYALEPLMKKHGWDAEVLKRDAATAARMLEQRQSERDALLKVIGQVESEIRGLNELQPFPIGRYQAMGRYLQEQHKMLAAKQKEVDGAQRTHEQIVAQARRLQRSIKGLEKHRDDRRKSYATECERKDVKEADNDWLARYRSERR